MWKNLVLVGMVVAVSGCGSGEQAQAPPSDDHEAKWQAVDTRVIEDYKTIGKGHILLVGDSLTAYHPATELCGVPVINAGYGGAKWGDVKARGIWDKIESRLVIVQLGTNNALYLVPISKEEMSAFFAMLKTDQLVVETTPPVSQALHASLASLSILAQLQTDELQAGYPTIDNRTAMNNAAFFTDGIHWNGLGYAEQRGIQEAVICPLLRVQP